MAFDLDRLLDLWTEPLPDSDPAAADRFRTVYADPVSVNGASLRVDDLVVRARALQAALENPTREVLGRVEAGDQVAVAFRMRGRQVGPLTTAAGVVPATGQILDLRVIDILTVQDGRISSIWMVADELGALAAIHAVTIAGPGSAG